MKTIHILNEEAVLQTLSVIESYEPMEENMQCPEGAMIVFHNTTQELTLLRFIDESFGVEPIAHRLEPHSFMRSVDMLSTRINSPHYTIDVVLSPCTVCYSDVAALGYECDSCGELHTHAIDLLPLN